MVGIPSGRLIASFQRCVPVVAVFLVAVVGFNLNLPLFFVLLKGLPDKIRGLRKLVKVILYILIYRLMDERISNAASSSPAPHESHRFNTDRKPDQDAMKFTYK